MSAGYLVGALCNGMQGEFRIHEGVSAIVGDIFKPLAFVCVVTAIELLLQQAAAASTALQGVFALGALFLWLVGDLTKTFCLEVRDNSDRVVAAASGSCFSCARGCLRFGWWFTTSG